MVCKMPLHGISVDCGLAVFIDGIIGGIMDDQELIRTAIYDHDNNLAYNSSPEWRRPCYGRPEDFISSMCNHI